MATAQEKRLMVRDKYRTIIGRNHYSQSLRNYCYKKYSDGRYYSDCSSSISHTYKEVGLGFGILNTVGMWDSAKLHDVPVIIEKGQIKNPEVLRIGDMLLFAGSDSSRKKWGYVGHVEMVGEIEGSKIMLYGHGSGNPKRHEMVAYCRTRYNSKSSTPVGNKGLIRVRRFILDEETTGDEGIAPTAGTRVLKNGMSGADVKAMQEGLIRLGFDCGKWGADGDFGDATEMAVRDFQQRFGLQVTGVFGQEDRAMMDKGLAALDKPVTDPGYVEIFGGNCYVRLGPGTEYEAIGVAYEGAKWPYTGIMYENGWPKIDWKGKEGWVSPKYARLVE